MYVFLPAQVTSDGGGLGSSWHLNEVEVTDTLRNKTIVFPCGQWLDPGDMASLTQTLLPLGVDGALGSLVQYEVSIYTSDLRGAGTDDNVSIELLGDKVRLAWGTMEAGGQECMSVWWWGGGAYIGSMEEWVGGREGQWVTRKGKVRGRVVKGCRGKVRWHDALSLQACCTAVHVRQTYCARVLHAPSTGPVRRRAAAGLRLGTRLAGKQPVLCLPTTAGFADSSPCLSPTLASFCSLMAQACTSAFKLDVRRESNERADDGWEDGGGCCPCIGGMPLRKSAQRMRPRDELPRPESWTCGKGRAHLLHRVACAGCPCWPRQQPH